MTYLRHSIDKSMPIRVSKHCEVMLIVSAITEATNRDASAEAFVDTHGPAGAIRSSGPSN